MIKIGKIVRYMEYKNMFILQHFLLSKKLLPKDFSIFIELYPNMLIPYFIEHTIKKADDILEIHIQTTLFMQIQKMDFLQKDIFIQNKDFLEYADFYSPLRYIDFEVYNQQHICIGKMKTVFEHQGKWYLQICNDKSEEILVYLYKHNMQEVACINMVEKKLILL